MLGIETLSGPAQALAEVGLVLAEAMVLYVVYGGLTSVFGTAVTDTIRGD